MHVCSQRGAHRCARIVGALAARVLVVAARRLCRREPRRIELRPAGTQQAAAAAAATFRLCCAGGLARRACVVVSPPRPLPLRVTLSGGTLRFACTIQVVAQPARALGEHVAIPCARKVSARLECRRL